MGGWGVVGAESRRPRWPASSTVLAASWDRFSCAFTGGGDSSAPGEQSAVRVGNSKAYKTNFFDVKTGSNGFSATAHGTTAQALAPAD
jgi:hypothetical protein